MSENTIILKGKYVAYVDVNGTVCLDAKGGVGPEIKSKSVEALLLLELVRLMQEGRS